MIFLTSAVLVYGEIINSAIVGTLATASKSRHRISIESRAAWIERAAEIEEGDYGAGDDDDHGEEEDYGDDGVGHARYNRREVRLILVQ